MSRRYSDVQMHYTSLFSQELSKLEPVLRLTSCMNPEDAELVGLIEIMKKHALDNPERLKRLETLSENLQIMGMSKWVKGEVTQLGLRLGHRHVKTINLSSDKDESEIAIDVGAT